MMMIDGSTPPSSPKTRGGKIGIDAATPASSANGTPKIPTTDGATLSAAKVDAVRKLRAL
jgi:hypothetical protein